jgi:release factor glutamine methyltransferase
LTDEETSAEVADGDTISWRTLLTETTDRLRAGGVPSPEVSARRIVEEVTGYEGADLALGLDEWATVRGVAALDAMVARRLAGEPLQYVLGRWGFRTLDLFVDRRVLIPRPETEQVVERALIEVDRLHRADPDRSLTVLDLGTGSGAIALSMAAERDFVDVWATDASADALAVARANLAGLGRAAPRVRMEVGDWFDAVPDALRGQFDVVVSNPPYIGADEPLPSEVVDWEPRVALVAGPRGDEAIEVLFATSRQWLAPGGSLVVEIAPHQRERVIDLGASHGWDAVDVHPDLSGRDRAAVARAPD